jgi:hypothetical protein
MPTTVALHQLVDLAHGESKNEILLETKLNIVQHTPEEPKDVNRMR